MAGKIMLLENSEVNIVCPKCGAKLIVKTNSYTQAQFLACPGYPECKHTEVIPEEIKMRALGQPTLFDNDRE